MSTNRIYLDFHPENQRFSTGKTLKKRKRRQPLERIKWIEDQSKNVFRLGALLKIYNKYVLKQLDTNDAV